MQKCDYCGRQNQDAAAYCIGCGTPLAPEPSSWEPLVDQQASEWILSAFRWALEQFGSNIFYARTILVTPTPDHFPDKSGDPHELVALVFARVRRYAGMENWPCKLVAQESDVDPVIDRITVIQNAPKAPGGTFSISGREQPEVVITYNPAALQRPQSLVAILAHELAHYLGHTAGCPPPGGEKNWEHATDLLAVFLGFGLFLANSAVHFQQFTGYNNQGWSSGTLGYLSEFELVYCLAIFCTLKKIGRVQVRSHLKSTLWPVYDNALTDLRRKGNVMSDLSCVNSVAKNRYEI